MRSMTDPAMRHDPCISVIMGVYNGERFLREAVDSVLSQTFGDFELLICDDGSTDGSAAILAEYAEKDTRVRLLKNPKNMGLAATLNHCLAEAEAEFIARMDSDDICLPDRFRAELEAMRADPGLAAIGCSVSYMDDSGRIYGERVLAGDSEITFRQAVKAAPMIHPTVMLRASALRGVEGYRSNALTTRAEDYDLWCRLCEAGCRLRNLPDILYCYREDESNISRRKYRYRVQEARLKYHWLRRSHAPLGDYRYAVRPLVLGLIPLGVYRRLHRRRMTKTEE